MNKSFFLVIAAVFCFGFSQAQEYSFGIKGGANYAFGGEIQGNIEGTVTPESEIGFHGGVFLQLEFGKFFVRPEVMYNTVETTFDFPNLASTSTYSVEKISVPLLIGYNVWGPVDIYAGPAVQKIMNATLDPQNQDITAQTTPLAAQAGVKLNFGRFELDLRYDHSLSKSPSPQNAGTVGDLTDSRLNQVLLSIGFTIGNNELNFGRKRGNCYF